MKIAATQEIAVASVPAMHAFRLLRFLHQNRKERKAQIAKIFNPSSYKFVRVRCSIYR